ncbi:MAG TPA: SRPBCC family protein [Chloroflexia bacterium]|nr:SRPBCC family protein [Chloroflexia bacterium]
MRFEETFQVPQDPQQVFPYLADVCNEAKWNPWAISVEKISDGPIGQGARFRGRYQRVGTAEQWLSEYIPAKHVVYQSNTMDGRMTFDLEPTAGGTQIRLVAEAQPTGLMKLMAPLMTPMMRKHIGDLAVGLKRELGG